MPEQPQVPRGWSDSSAVSSILAFQQQFRVHQHTNVFQYGGPAHLEFGHELRDCTLLLCGMEQDLPASVAREGAKDTVERFSTVARHSI